MRYVLTLLAFLAFPAFANEGTITIPYKEYEEMKKAIEADEGKQYWNMTFQQILDKERGNEKKAWGLYEFWVLRRVYLEGPVNGGSVSKAIDAFRVLSEIDTKKPIELVIRSPGGYVFDGLQLYNAMMTTEPPIHTVCDGLAMSMAAVILSAGDHRVARDGCIFMIHEMAGGAPGGQTTEQIKTADIYMSLENILTRILAENSGLSMADVRTLWALETWWNADEAKRLGFVDEVLSGKPRALAMGSRSIPEGYLPNERVVRHITERLGQ